MRAGHAGMGGVGPSEVRAINVSFQRVALPFDAKAVYLQCYSASLVDQDRMSSGTPGQASSQRLEACPNTVRLGHIDRGNVMRPISVCGIRRGFVAASAFLQPPRRCTPILLTIEEQTYVCIFVVHYRHFALTEVSCIPRVSCTFRAGKLFSAMTKACSHSRRQSL